MYLTKFDPWGSSLCTCPLKYSLAPYTGCFHGCLYCYITSYIPRAFEPRPKKNFLKVLTKELKKANKDLPVSLSNSSDPYIPLEKDLYLTKKALMMLFEAGFKILITTKSTLVLRDLEILKAAKAAVAISICTLDGEVARIIEPYAPSPVDRLKAVKELSDEKIKVLVRLDPIIPGLTDDVHSMTDVIEASKEAGAFGITASTFKPRWDSLRRMSEAFSSLCSKWEKIYLAKKARVMYAPENYRYEIMCLLKEMCDGLSLSFATCREGFFKLHTASSCDGTHLIGS